MALYTRMRPRVYLEFQSAPLDAADPGDWIEVTELVKDLDFQHGRSRASDDFQPGSGRVVLDNRDSRFDPTNTDGPYYGLLKLRRKIRVDAYLQVYDDTDGSTVSDYDITIAFGWVTSWNDQWRWRRLVDTTVTWTDALGLLANHDLPDSVWDYRIKTLVDAGKVVAWYRWDDDDSTAVDASGNGNHGRYVIGENGGDPTSAAEAPVGVVRAGRGDPVIPQVERPGLSFGRMVAEAGQPATAPTLGWRYPCVVASDTTALWGAEFSVETWVRYRAAFSLSAAGLASATTARRQWLTYWGFDPYANSRAFGFSTAGQPLAEAAYYGEFVPGTPPPFWLALPAVGTTVGTQTIDDNSVHHMVWTVERTTSFGYDISRVKMYVDGLLMATGGTKDISDAGYPLPGGRPLMIGFQHQRLYPSVNASNDFGFGLEIGDLVVYNETLSAGDVLTNYRAGKYGNLSASAYLVASSAAEQAATMAGYAPGVFTFGTTAKTVAAGKTAGKTVVDYLRELARGEDALMWQDRYGELRLDAESWKRGVGPWRHSAGHLH
jgi:hypothetical protein